MGANGVCKSWRWFESAILTDLHLINKYAYVVAVYV